MIVCFYFVLIGLIKGLKVAKNMKIFIPVILFCGNRNLCLEFMWWVLCVLLLLKIIVSMERFYVGVWGMG